jgi:flagellar hook-associated protein FlgK
MSAMMISLSGMQAAQARLGAVAHNVANLSTENFHRQSVAQSESVAGGVSASLPASSVSGNALETDMVEQIQAKNDFLGNLAVLKASSSMLGSLFEARA